MNARWLSLFALLILAPAALAAAPASAAGPGASTHPTQGLHAFLDRDHAALGDTVTLNIEGAGALSGTPDLSPLQSDFDVLGTSSSSKVQIVNGVSHVSAQLGIALRTKRAGTLTIPPLRIGSQQTQALALQVAAAPIGALGQAGDPVFLEASVDATAPYIGQQIVYTLKLFYAGSLTGGQLEDPQADGAQIIHLSGDTRYQTARDGQNYQVVERHYALIPQRTGRIVVRGPSFLGQMLSSNRNDPFGGFLDDGTPVQARADDIALQTRAAPASAGTPWLPAQSVELHLSGLPDNGKVKAGEPLTLTLSVDATGTSAERLPEPQLPSLEGARVYPDRTRDITRDDGRWLHATRTRAFAIVPTRAGTLTIPAITLNWWNVARDRAEQARLPAHALTVVDGVAASAQPPANSAAVYNNAGAVDLTRVAGRGAVAVIWRDVALASIALWLIALTALAWWWFAQRPQANASVAAEQVERTGLLRRRALDAAQSGDAAASERALLAWARAEQPGVRNAADLKKRLIDTAQCDALEDLQRARWKGGDAAIACDSVAKAFARGFAWRTTHVGARRDDRSLPPLYPERT